MSMELAKTAEGRKEQMKLIKRYNKQLEDRKLYYKEYEKLINSSVSKEQISNTIGDALPLLCY